MKRVQFNENSLKTIEEKLFELSVAKSPTKDTARIRAIKKKLKYELEKAHQLFFGEVHDTPTATTDERQRFLKIDKLFKRNWNRDSNPGSCGLTLLIAIDKIYTHYFKNIFDTNNCFGIINHIIHVQITYPSY